MILKTFQSKSDSSIFYIFNLQSPTLVQTVYPAIEWNHIKKSKQMQWTSKFQINRKRYPSPTYQMANSNDWMHYLNSLHHFYWIIYNITNVKWMIELELLMMSQINSIQVILVLEKIGWILEFTYAYFSKTKCCNCNNINVPV